MSAAIHMGLLTKCNKFSGYVTSCIRNTISPLENLMEINVFDISYTIKHTKLAFLITSVMCASDSSKQTRVLQFWIDWEILKRHVLVYWYSSLLTYMSAAVTKRPAKSISIRYVPFLFNAIITNNVSCFCRLGINKQFQLRLRSYKIEAHNLFATREFVTSYICPSFEELGTTLVSYCTRL